MKPILLTINAFGPYVEKTVIDFEKLGNDGLYLITGDTGAGKTTIFDAICFVLYGSASGHFRSNSKALRSDFAKEDNKTYVEMEFINKGEKYKIRRDCGYDRTTRTGSITTESEKAILTKPDGVIVSNLKEVNKEIENILGIDKNQFAQIVMIAQGEFQKLLFASTNERMTIFRRIFKTHAFEKFQIELKSRLKSSNEEVKTIQESIFQYIRDINENPKNEELTNEKNSILANNNIYEIKPLLTLVSDANKLEEQELEASKEKLKSLQDEKDKLQQELQLAQIVADAKKDFEELTKKLPLKEKEAQDNQKLYLDEKANEKQRTDLSNQINKLQSDLEKYKALDDLNEKLKTAKTSNEKKQNELNSSKDIFEKEKAKYETDKKDIEKYNNIDVELTQNAIKKENNEKQADKLEEIANNLKEYKEEKENLKTKQEDVVKAQSEYSEKQKLADEVFAKYTSNLAGILAQNLKDKEACPVCGSTSHPKKATLTNDSVTQEDYEKAKTEAENKQKENLEIAQAASKLASSVQLKEKSLIKDAKDLFKTEVIEGLEEKIEKAQEDNSKELENIKKEKKELEQKALLKNNLAKAIKLFEDNREKTENEIKKSEKEVQDLLISIKGLETSISEQKKDLQFKDEKEASDKLLEYKNELETSKKKLENLEKNNNESQKELTQIKTQIEEKKKVLEENKAQDLDVLKEKNLKLDDEIKALNENNNSVFHRIETNKRVLASIEKQSSSLEKASEKLRILENLSATANGTLVGKMKISFENYVLARFFDSIIYAANKRFKNMTSSQFELRRNKEKGGSAQTGLDLDVFDSYTTKTRDVSTLSGGESFKAALSLALGLSDVIQQQAGGISVDTMFIDEGFGSLDNESLEQTMKILFELSGNKTLIGIISHVSELREKIERKIEVKKTQTGSVLKMNIP